MFPPPLPLFPAGVGLGAVLLSMGPPPMGPTAATAPPAAPQLKTNGAPDDVAAPAPMDATGVSPRAGARGAAPAQAGASTAGTRAWLPLILAPGFLAFRFVLARTSVWTVCARAAFVPFSGCVFARLGFYADCLFCSALFLASLVVSLLFFSSVSSFPLCQMPLQRQTERLCPRVYLQSPCPSREATPGS